MEWTPKIGDRVAINKATLSPPYITKRSRYLNIPTDILGTIICFASTGKAGVEWDNAIFRYEGRQSSLDNGCHGRGKIHRCIYLPINCLDYTNKWRDVNCHIDRLTELEYAKTRSTQYNKVVDDRKSLPLSWTGKETADAPGQLQTIIDGKAVPVWNVIKEFMRKHPELFNEQKSYSVDLALEIKRKYELGEALKNIMQERRESKNSPSVKGLGKTTFDIETSPSGIVHFYGTGGEQEQSLLEEADTFKWDVFKAKVAPASKTVEPFQIKTEASIWGIKVHQTIEDRLNEINQQQLDEDYYASLVS